MYLRKKNGRIDIIIKKAKKELKDKEGIEFLDEHCEMPLCKDSTCQYVQSEINKYDNTRLAFVITTISAPVIIIGWILYECWKCKIF